MWTDLMDATKVGLRTYVLLSLIVSLPACGGDAGNSAASDAPAADIMNGAMPSRAPAPQQSAGTAEAEGIDCAAVSARGGEGPDVVGVTIGMSAEDAYAKIACSNRALRVRYSESDGFQLPALPDGRRPRTMVIGEGGGDRIEASLVGLPGQERVVAVTRDINFAEGQQPPSADLQQQLNAKYLQMTHNDLMTASYHAAVTRRADGTLVAPDDHRLLLECRPSPQGRVNLGDECGTSVAVAVYPAERNRQLARRLIVVMTGGAFGIAQIEAFAAHAQGATQQRNAEEVDAARGRGPNL